MKKSIHIFLPFSFVVEKLDLKEEFKNNWNSDKKIRKEIINDLKKELSDKHRDYQQTKRTILWIINIFRGKNE